MPEHLYPETIHFNTGDTPQMVLQQIHENSFAFPLIGKPDIGGRGRGVKVLESNDEVIHYVKNACVDFHIQRFVPLKHEVGIFYYRYPDQSSGKISGIVSKEFLAVTGDGTSSIKTLLLNNDRASLQMKSLTRIYGHSLETILGRGEEKVLVPYGNHARGAKFLDHTHLADPKLTAVIDNVCKSIKEFYYGRLDIRYNDWAELTEGKNFCVIEVNGAGSEPTHIYDPRHSLFFAWKEIIRHWIILWRISMMNHKRGYPYLSISDGIKMFKEDKLHSKKLAAIPE